jgi:hypothetical protein
MPDVVRAVLVTADELEVASVAGASRILARLGETHRYFPFPTWNDPRRASVAVRRELKKSVVPRTAAMNLGDACVLVAGGTAHLRLTPRAGAELAEALVDAPADIPLTLLTGIHPDANACPVWRPGQRDRRGIGPEGSDGSRMSACFLTLTPSGDRSEGRWLEDGLAFVVAKREWAGLLDAIENHTPATVAADDLTLALDWLDRPPDRRR